MELGGKWPVSIVATPDVAAGARLWRTAGSHRLTIVVKSTFSPAHQQPMQLAAPDGLIVDDAHLDGDDSRSVIASSDLAPYLPRAEVLFVGCAHSQAPVPGLSVRIGIYGVRPLIEKTLHVVGSRTLSDNGAGPPELFVELPILYEQALRGAMDENPVGIVPAPGVQMPTILDPDDAGSPAGFGPLSPRWPGRRRLLRQLDPGLLEAAVPELPDAFAWSFFQAAPPDQRCPFFVGDEWMVLDNLWPGAARLESRLPSARAGARVYDGPRFMDVPLIADTLFIDGTRQLVSVVWRGNVPVDPARLSEINVMAGLELPGRPIPWPEPAQPSIPEIASAPSAPPQAQQESWQAPPTQATQGSPQPTPVPPEVAAARQSGLHQAVAQAEAPPQAYQPNPSGLHQAVAQQQAPQPQAYTPNPSGQYQAAQPQQPYAANPSGQHQAVGQPQQGQPQQAYGAHASGQHQAVAQPSAGYVPHPSGQYQAAQPQQPQQQPQQPVPPQAPQAYAPHPSGQYAAAAPDPQAYAQAPNVAYPQAGSYAEAGQARAPTPPPGSTPGLRMRNPTPAPHVRQPTPTMGQAIPAQMLPGQMVRTPTPPPGSPRPGFDSRPKSDPHGGLPAPPPAMPPPPPPAGDDEIDNDEGHTVMRPVDAKLLEQLASMDGPTTVGRNQQLQAEAAAAAAAAAPILGPPPPPPGPKVEERAESTALFTISADTTLMRLARGEVPSPVSQVETARRPTAEHQMNLDEQTVVGDQNEIDRLLNDAATTSSRGQSPAAVAVAGLRPVPPAPPTPSAPTDGPMGEDFWAEDGPSTQNDPHVPLQSTPPPTMAVPSAPTTPPAEQNRRALRATSRGLGPVHVMEAEVLPPVDAPVPSALPETKPFGPPQMDATRSGGQSLQQALRAEMLGRLAAGQSFAEANLEGQDLSGLDLSGKVFTNANLRGVRMERTKLDGADLSGAKLDGAQLTGASMTGARLVGASLEEAVLDGAMLLSAALDEANLSKASLAGCVIVDATATRANFREAELRDARLDRSRLGSADFERAKLTNASFLATDLTDASFFEAAGVSASFVEANLGGARFEQSHFALARFSRATAADTLWNESVLDGASFEAASLAGATFAKASCLGTIFSSSDLTEARFQRAKLDGATFTGADTEGAVFDTGSPPTAPPSVGGFNPTSM